MILTSSSVFPFLKKAMLFLKHSTMALFFGMYLHYIVVYRVFVTVYIETWCKLAKLIFFVNGVKSQSTSHYYVTQRFLSIYSTCLKKNSICFRLLYIPVWYADYLALVSHSIQFNWTIVASRATKREPFAKGTQSSRNLASSNCVGFYLSLNSSFVLKKHLFSIPTLTAFIVGG